MALKATLKSLDEVSEELHEHYAEKKINGETIYVLDIKGVDDHPDVRGVITANAENKRKRDELRTKLEEKEAQCETLISRFEGLPDDFNADQYAAMKAAAEGKDMPDVNKIREEAERKEKERAARREEQLAAEYEAQIKGLMKYKDFTVKTTVEGGLAQALEEAGVDPRYKRGALAMLQAKGDVKFVESDEEGFRAVVEGDLGEVDLARFVRDWAESEEGKPYIAQPKGGDEPGSRTTGGGFKTNPFTAQDWSKTAQASEYRSDPARAARMARAAGFKDVDAALKASQPPKAA